MNLEQFFRFCFELRRQDTDKDYYTAMFLDDRIHNEMILNIIHSNFYKDKKMQIRDKLKFRMSVGTNGYIYQYYEGVRVYEWPFVKSYQKKAYSSEL